MGQMQGARDLSGKNYRDTIITFQEGGDSMEEKEADLLNEVYREISTVMGLDSAISIYQMYKGQQITFPVHLFNAKRIQNSIIKEYDGTNLRDLAKKYGYSEKTIRRMIKDSLEEQPG